jgi:uncharacterized repeat protein (TIGR03806 family)
VRRAFAAMAAALCCVSGAATMGSPAVDQTMIEGEAMPQKLSEFGFGMTADGYRPASSVGYTLRTPLFSDYADKQRFIYIPTGREARVVADGTIEFPVGTVLFKSFGWPDHNGGKPVETRLLIHRKAGWTALPYIWDADGKDATLALGGRRVPVTFKSPDGETHRIRYAVPNKNQCKECHSKNGVIEPIGPKMRNVRVDQIGMQKAPPIRFRTIPARGVAMPMWDDPASGTVAQRARAYLDVNCAHCHNPAGSASNSGLFLRWTDDPTGVNYGIGKRPTAAGRGSGGMDFAIAPGDAARSFMIYRLESTDPGIAMPEVGRSTVHKEGAALLRQWIAEMPKASH